MKKSVLISLYIYSSLFLLILPTALLIYTIFFNWNIAILILAIMFYSFAPSTFKHLNKISISNKNKQPKIYKNWKYDSKYESYKKEGTSHIFNKECKTLLNFSNKHTKFTESQIKKTLASFEESSQNMLLQLKQHEENMLKEIAREFEETVVEFWIEDEDIYQRKLIDGEMWLNIVGQWVKTKNSSAEMLNLIDPRLISITYDNECKQIQISIHIALNLDIIGFSGFACNLLYQIASKKLAFMKITIE